MSTSPRSQPLSPTLSVDTAAGQLRLDAVAPGVFRLRLGATARATSLIRYGIVQLPAEAPTANIERGADWQQLGTAAGSVRITAAGAVELRDATGTVRLSSTELFAASGEGFTADFALTADEGIQGLGDVTRERLGKRGFRTEIWVRNVASYVPIPWLCSSRGWGLFANTTWRHYADVGATRSDRLRLGAREGDLDLFLVLGDGYGQLIERFTALTGRPALLPLWGYGLTFVCNEQANAREMVDDCLNLRRADIPCDLVGLEPGWMSQHYDGSTEKTWHKDRFYIPGWIKPQAAGSQNPDTAGRANVPNPQTFLGATSRLGFKTSLWLCCEYDLTHEAERRAKASEKAVESAAIAPVSSARHPDDFEQDQHFGHEPRLMDRQTKPAEPWYQHLSAFVAQGVSAFKLDGAFQVNDHPDRRYGNGMTDEECHNLYPTLLNQQMALGFAEQTGNRPMIYSSGGYTGIQRFSATWAGDTGGGPKPLASMLNHAFVGHSNVSCDMDVFTPAGIHFGFLQTWAQVNSWAYWRHPWLLGDTLLPIFRAYAKLRYRLLPYLYSAAHQAHATGQTVMRPLALTYPDDRACDEVITQYLLGDALHVGVFNDRLYLPSGTWYDFWTGERITGGQHIAATWPADRGGALHVKAGSIVPLWPEMEYVGQKPVDHLELLVWSGADSASSLVEDDGVTLPDPLKRATTALSYREDGRSATLAIGARQGSYPGMPATRSYTVRWHGPQPAAVEVDRVAVAVTREDSWTVFTIAADRAREVRIRW
jgi:alpha-glucosidase (family GH31 glycosyl hydrolase)